MSKDDEAERKTFGGIIPARPKGAPGPTPPKGAWNPLDNMLKQAGRQTMSGPAKLEFADINEDIPPAAFHNQKDPMEVLVEISRALRPLSKKERKLVIAAIADLLD